MTEPASYLVNDADLPSLREAISNLARKGYSEAKVRERMGLRDLGELQWQALPLYRDERLAARDPLDLSIDLLLLQGVLPADELGRLFVAADREVLIRAGLLHIDEAGAARARASLFPVDDRLIFSDHAWPQLPHPGYPTVPYDQVMFVGADSRALARCALRRPVRAALDLCTGSGVQALLAASHAQRVLAVDVSSRATLCARFNAQVLGAANVEVVTGDLFEPVRGEQFDLITANPPFVPSPLDSLRFRDGGRSGEDIQKRIVAGLPHHLAPGGTAQMVTELGERDQEPLTNRLRAWLEGAPMDIHAIRLHEYSATKYAIGHAKGDDYSVFLESVRVWGGNLQAQGYTRVTAVLVSFQWSDPACGAPWERIDESPLPQRPAGREIEAIFLAERMTRKFDPRDTLKRNRLRRAGPVALLDGRLLGREIPATAKATLLGQALPMEHQLDSTEREILVRAERSIGMAELLAISRELDVSEENVIVAVTSLLRRRLVRLDVRES